MPELVLLDVDVLVLVEVVVLVLVEVVDVDVVEVDVVLVVVELVLELVLKLVSPPPEPVVPLELEPQATMAIEAPRSETNRARDIGVFPFDFKSGVNLNLRDKLLSIGANPRSGTLRFKLDNSVSRGSMRSSLSSPPNSTI
jgi:hypothetical protein